jgi:hypothetical protein
MRTLLRKVSSGLFFQGPGKWTNNPAEAKDFKLIDRALTFIDTWHLEEVELVFAFRDRPNVTRIPRERMALKYSRD